MYQKVLGNVQFHKYQKEIYQDRTVISEWIINNNNNDDDEITSEYCGLSNLYSNCVPSITSK